MPKRTVCRLSDLPDGRGHLVEVDGDGIALFRLGDEVHALSDVCPHRGASLSSGDLRGETVFCPLHAWGFDIRTGRCDEFPASPVRAYAVEIVGGEVRIEVEERPRGEAT